jgi:hypothetical protein
VAGQRGHRRGAFWLANESGVLACADPGTGRLRARTQIRQGAVGPELLAVSKSSHIIYAVVSAGLVAISPPAGCWR